MSPETYDYRYAAIATIAGDDPALITPAEYAAAGPAERMAAAVAFAATVVAMLDRLRAVAAVSEWTAELHARTVLDIEEMLTTAAAP